MNFLLNLGLFIFGGSVGAAITYIWVNKLKLSLAIVTSEVTSLRNLSEEIKNIRDKNSIYLEEKSIALTEKRELEKKLEVAINERNLAQEQKEKASVDRLEAQKHLALIQQKMTDNENRMKDWESQGVEYMKATKASILEAGSQLSNKLLEDHKREAEASKKESEEIVKKTSNALFDQMRTVTESVAALKEQNSETKEKMSTVWQALSSPAGAGYIAEIGLENTLKNIGLLPLRDYIMQYAIPGESGNLRPDAVIFLPQDMVMVIDSKASKYLLEIASAQDEISKLEALARLSKTMNDHLKDLVSRDYKNAIALYYRQAGRANQIKNILTIMYLPHENAISHLKQADPEFAHKAEKSGIILSSNSSLHGLLSIANLNIGIARQAENQDTIIAHMQDTMDNVVTVLTHAEKVGKSLKSAADHFESFASSVNGRLLPKLQKIMSLGVMPKKKAMPMRIPSLEVRATDTLMIEAETVENFSIEEELPKKLSA